MAQAGLRLPQSDCGLPRRHAARVRSAEAPTGYLRRVRHQVFSVALAQKSGLL